MHLNDTTKVCRKCGETKPLDDYTIDVRYRDGRYPWCAACRRAWREGRKEQYQEYQRNWKDQNRDHVRTYEREYFRNNDEQRERNRAAGRVRDRERYHNDPEHRRRKDAQAAAKNRRRRAMLYGAPTEHHTDAEWVALCERYDHRCLRCRRQLPLSRDHVIPVTLGGSDAITNIQPLCTVCNSWKNNRIIDFRLEWDV